MAFSLSIAFNLILIQKIFKKFSDYNSIKTVSRKIRINYFAAFVIALLAVSIYPSFVLMYDGVQLRINKPPGGNEKNLYFWLYENTNYNDLILNDPTQTGFHLVGLRAQSLINMHPDIGEISYTYDKKNRTI